MSKIFASSPIIQGIIEDLEISKLKTFKYHYRSINESEIGDLMNSISAKGILQPIIVRNMDTYYEIIAGHRRFESCKRLGWKKILCHIVNVTDKEAFEISITENVQRKDLNPLEEAEAYKKYIEGFGWGGISDLAKRMGKSVSYIYKRIQFLNLPYEIQSSLSEDSGISPSIIDELLFLKDKSKQPEVFNLIKEKKLSVREARDVIKETNDNPDSPYYYEDKLLDNNNNMDFKNSKEVIYRAFDKVIEVLKMTIKKFCHILETVENDWVVYETLSQHVKNMNNQIDLLIKERKKYLKKFH